jgi:hypothetical protein
MDDGLQHPAPCILNPHIIIDSADAFPCRIESAVRQEFGRIEKRIPSRIWFYSCVDLTLYSNLPGWRNWQTRYIQGVVSARACRFDSCSRHKEEAVRFCRPVEIPAFSIFGTLRVIPNLTVKDSMMVQGLASDSRRRYRSDGNPVICKDSALE